MAEDQQTETQPTPAGSMVEAPMQQWPPPPTYVQPASNAHTADIRYSSTGKLSNAIAGLLSVMIVFGIARLIAPASTHDLVDIASLIMLPAGILFMVWSYRTYRNIQIFGCKGLKSGPWWAALSYILPIVNLWWPAVIVYETWKASDPNILDPSRRSWNKASGNAAIVLWWLTFQLYYAGWTLERGTASLDPLTGRIIGALCLVSAVLGIIVTRQITQRQNDKWAAIMQAAVDAPPNYG